MGKASGGFDSRKHDDAMCVWCVFDVSLMCVWCVFDVCLMCVGVCLMCV